MGSLGSIKKVCIPVVYAVPSTSGITALKVP